MGDEPGWTQGGSPDAGKPQIYDKAPPPSTGVPFERDPVSGKLLSGDPLGRGDKGRGNTGRSVRTPGKTALITGAAVTVTAAVALTVVLVTRNAQDPDPAASAGGVQTSSGDQQTSDKGTTSAAPTTTASAEETGPRTVPITFTATKVTPPPGFGPDPTQGSAGDELTFSWTLKGPCDGAGTCELEQCDDSGCGSFGVVEPEGGGYSTRFSYPIAWDVPECTGGTVDNTLTWTVTGNGDDVAVTGSWVQEAAQVLFTGSDGRDCTVYLTEWTIASQ
jgi:hypothetical protein